MAKYKPIKIKRVKKSVKRPVLLRVSKVGFKTAKFIAVTKLKIKYEIRKKTAEAIIRAAPDSTGFTNDTENNPAGKAGELLFKGSEKAGGAALHSPKHAARSVKRTVKSVKKTVKNVKTVSKSAKLLLRRWAG